MVNERKELFFYVVICSALLRSVSGLVTIKHKVVSLLRIPATEKEKNQRLIEMARQRFFSDREFWQCAIAFADIHNTLDEIFR